MQPSSVLLAVCCCLFSLALFPDRALAVQNFTCGTVPCPEGNCCINSRCLPPDAPSEKYEKSCLRCRPEVSVTSWTLTGVCIPSRCNDSSWTNQHVCGGSYSAVPPARPPGSAVAQQGCSFDCTGFSFPSYCSAGFFYASDCSANYTQNTSLPQSVSDSYRLLGSYVTVGARTSMPQEVPTPLEPHLMVYVADPAQGPARWITLEEVDDTGVCCPGFYCPERYTCMFHCTLGAFCTSPAKYSEESGAAKLCDPYDYSPRQTLGCGGANADHLCDASYFCPMPHVRNTCPEGSYCREGSFKPRDCPPLSTCNEGSEIPDSSVLAVAILAIVAAWVCLMIYLPGLWSPFLLFMLRYPWFAARFEARLKRFRLIPESDMPTPATPSVVDDGPDSPESDAVVPESFTVSTEVLKPKTDRLLLECRNLSLTVGKKSILNNVSASFQPGQMTAVMGPSGSGKSSLVSAMMDKAYYGVVSGSILVNGRTVTPAELHSIKSVIGYCPQEHIVLPELTVYETMMFNALWRLDRSVSMQRRQQIVEEVLRVLKLTHRKDAIVGDAEARGISGGEKARVNIGMELVADPLLLVCDEATSGLDSAASDRIISVLKSIARLGSTVVVIIHQPRFETFEKFDNIVLMAEGGYLAYQGPYSQLASFFDGIGLHCPEKTNPADFYLDCLAGKGVPSGAKKPMEAMDIVKAWKKHTGVDTDPATEAEPEHKAAEPLSIRLSPLGARSPLSQSGSPAAPSAGSPEVRVEVDVPRGSQTEEASGWLNFPLSTDLAAFRRDQPGFVWQLALCTGRGVLQMRRHLSTFLSDCVLFALVGYLLAVLFRPPALTDAPAVCLFTTMTFTLGPTTQGLRLFGEERLHYWREAANGINTVAYFLGKNLASFIPMVIIPLLFMATYYSFYFPYVNFTDLYGLIFVAQCTGMGLGQLVSQVAHPSKAHVMGVAIGLLSVLLCGFSPTLSDLDSIGVPAKILYSISISRWLQEAFLTFELANYPPVYATSTVAVLSTYSYSSSSASWSLFENSCLQALVAMLFAFRIAAFAAMVLLNRGKQR